MRLCGFFPLLSSGKAGLPEAERTCPTKRRALVCSRREGRRTAVPPRPCALSPRPSGRLPAQAGAGDVRASPGPLVCSAHSCCVNIYKTLPWTLQMSKCLLFRRLCQYSLSTSLTGTRTCLSGSRRRGCKPACRSEQVREGGHLASEAHAQGMRPEDTCYWNKMIFSFSCTR